jgi:hypothetical protein
MSTIILFSKQNLILTNKNNKNMNEYQLKQQLRGQVIRIMFTPVLEKFKNDPAGLYLEEILPEVKEKTAGILNPDLIVWVSLLEEEVELRKNIITLVQDIIKLDWEKDGTELQFESMKKCLDSMNERNDELAVIIMKMREGME